MDAVVIDERVISEAGEGRTVESGLVLVGVRAANCLPVIADPEVPVWRTALRSGGTEAGGSGCTVAETEGDGSPGTVVVHSFTMGNTVFSDAEVSKKTISSSSSSIGMVGAERQVMWFLAGRQETGRAGRNSPLSSSDVMA